MLKIINQIEVIEWAYIVFYWRNNIELVAVLRHEISQAQYNTGWQHLRIISGTLQQKHRHKTSLRYPTSRSLGRSPLATTSSKYRWLQ